MAQRAARPATCPWRWGIENVTSGLALLRDEGSPGFAGLAQFAERQVAFAMVFADEIVRLQANESTPI